MKILIIGNGYIGNRCHQAWPGSVLATNKLHSLSDVQSLLDKHQPDVVLNAAGTRGKPNVDWCEDHKFETYSGNVSLPMIIAEACASRGTYLLHIGSGCVFYGDSPEVDGWKESDIANPISYYSKTKYAADLLLQDLDNVGVARIRIPLDEFSAPSNIIDKLVAYPKIIDVENSITVIPDMIDVFYQLLEQRARGIFHVTNPGSISYRAIIDLYNRAFGVQLDKQWISEDELIGQGLVTKTRSTNKLQSRLAEVGITMPPVEKAVRQAIDNYGKRNNS